MSERQASNFKVGSFTSAHVQALRILSQNNVCYLAEEPVSIFGEFDDGKPYQTHAAEFMVRRKDENGLFHLAMLFCREHFLVYAATVTAESGKGDEA